MTATAPREPFAWCDGRWSDPLTGTEVVRVSPRAPRHFRTNYFRHQMTTHDGRWVVFSEFAALEHGRDVGPRRLWARGLLTGELRDLGPLPDATPWGDWAVAPRTNRVSVLDPTVASAVAILTVDIDSGAWTRIEPDKPLPHIYEATFSADERYVYTPWWREAWPLRASMSDDDWRAMVCARPGEQEMVRIDLVTGEVTTVFTASTWWIGHPNPHPLVPGLLMCCQEAYGTSEKYGEPVEFERIRLYDVDAARWVTLPRAGRPHATHEHWARRGRRIYGHTWVDDHHALLRVDLDAATYDVFPCPDGDAGSDHVRVAPDESFLVGDGHSLDVTMLTADLRARLDRMVAAGQADPLFGAQAAANCGGAETVWKYELPPDGPGGLVRVSPIARFRSLARGPMLGFRLEANAHVTEDSEWVLFQSSNDDDFFEVWAARVPRR